METFIRTAAVSDLTGTALSGIESLDRRLAGLGPVVEDMRLDGSILSGMAVPPVRDADVMLFIAADREIAPELGAAAAELAGGRFEGLLFPRRFGRGTVMAHVSAPAPEGRGLFELWDLWLVHAPFVTMSPYWQALFSPAEINWQRRARELVRDNLSSEEYGQIKTLQLAEARWRFCACHGLPLVKDLPPELLADLPLHGPPPAGTKDFVRRWAEGDRSDSWLSRPLAGLPYETRLAIEALDPAAAEPPAPPVWTDAALGVQLEARLQTCPSQRLFPARLGPEL